MVPPPLSPTTQENCCVVGKLLFNSSARCLWYDRLISGDLAFKKTYPALFGLFRNKFLPPKFQIVGYARSKLDLSEFKKRISSKIKLHTEADKDLLVKFLDRCYYVAGQYDDENAYKELNTFIEKLEGPTQGHHRLFYMALPPSVFAAAAKGLKNNVYVSPGTNRLIVEKPFGRDLETSRALAQQLGQLWAEEEIYRIDHYLGKEMVKNLMVLRFANIFFGAIWNRNYIDNVQITFKEPFGTEGRGGYFDEFGIIRDVSRLI